MEPRPGAAHGRISDDGRMDWTFTCEVIEWRGPAPYLFVAMTPEDSEDLREAARGLIYWGQVPVRVTIGGTEFSTALFPRDGRYLVPVKVAVQRAEAIGEGAIVEVVLRLTPRAGNDERMALRQPDDQIIAVEVVVKGDTAHQPGVRAQ
jgi:Domain of unknown function (DUF1905)